MRIALAVAALSLCGIAGAQNQADVAYLQNGVTEIAPAYDNGSLVVFGDQAFPVVNAGLDPLIAAARLGKGRVVVLGSTACLEQDVFKIADSGRMMANMLRWAAGGKIVPKVGVYKIGGLVRRLKSLSPGIDLDARDIELRDRGQVDVVVIPGRFVNAEDVGPLQTYIRDGGGLVTAGVGSFMEARLSGVDLATGVPGNQLISPAGVVWGRAALGHPPGRGFRVEPPADLSHVGKAIEAFEAGEAGKRILSEKELVQVRATLFRAILDLPHDDATVLPRIDRALTPFYASAVPSAAIPITIDDLPWRLAITREIQQLRWTAPEQVRAHPAAAEFPGAVPPSAPRITATVHVETSQGRWGWIGTGLYAAPGEVITLRVPQNILNRRLGVVIGVHTDTLWHLEDWMRMPEIVLQKDITSAEMRVASAFGGPIFISAPEDGKAGDFDAVISGGVAAPRYVDGKTSLSDWRSTIRNLGAPWAEIESDKIILSVPSRFARDLDDPAALMGVWNRISDLVSEFENIPKTRLRAERLVPDVQISAGIQHAGYPVMMYLGKAQTLLSVEELLKGRVEYTLHNRAMWGLPHELGHQAHNPWVNFDGAEEPMANMCALYVMERLCHIPVASSLFGSAEFRAEQMAKYNFAKPNFTQWKDDRWIGTAFYVQLQQAFGWEAFRSVSAEYLKLPASQRPISDSEKRDQWMVRFSRQVHRNLGPFFQTWGIPTSEAARASIAELPGWMPEELPAAARGAAGR